MPFVQGHLRQAAITITFDSKCAHCAAPLRIEIDHELRATVAGRAAPLAFLPLVDFEKLETPSIIDPF